MISAGPLCGGLPIDATPPQPAGLPHLIGTSRRRKVAPPAFIAELLEPVMTLLNAIPRVILAPLFVIWLGIGLASKVALSFILVAVLIFFTVFTGIRQVDRRLVE